MDREAPHRFGKQLYQLWRACGLLGMTREQAREVCDRVAKDSLPKLRRRVLEALVLRGRLSTNTVARAVTHPRKSTQRALEDLTAHGVVTRDTDTKGAVTTDYWQLTETGSKAALLFGRTEPEMSAPLQKELMP